METSVRHLTRSRHSRVFAGVCGGLAAYLGWDPVLIRVAYVVLTLLSFGAAGILLYLAAWLFIPLEPERTAEMSAQEPPAPGNTRKTIGVLLLVAGALALLDSFMPWFWHMFRLHIMTSVVLIAAGLLIIFWKAEPPAAAPAGAPATGPMPPPVTPEPAPSSARRRLFRLQRGRKIAGVCAGLGEHFGIDPTIVRLLFVALVFAGGSGILLYIILWLVMPLELT